MAQPIYLDNNATTAADPLVVAEMVSLLEKNYGNPASTTHSFGWFAEETVKIARERVAGLIDGEPDEIVFTSGATESNNLVILGSAGVFGDSDAVRIVSDEIEHRSVLDPLEYLRSQGANVRLSPVTADGLIDLEQFSKLLSPQTSFVTLMLGNNEIGTLFDLTALIKLCRERAPLALIHCDATQAAGKIPVSVKKLGLDLLSLSAHKIYGPKGVGALWVRSDVESALRPLVFGGGHEKGLRSGTLNVPGIGGFGKACQLAAAGLETEGPRLKSLARRFLDGIRKTAGEVKINGSVEHRLPGNLNIQIEGIQSSSLLGRVGTKVALSASSACTSGKPGGSFVLRALGDSPAVVSESIRVGFGRFNTEDEIDSAVTIIADAVKKIREGGGA